VPGLIRVGYMRNPATPGGAEQAARASTVARELGLDFVDLPVRVPDEINAGVAAAADAGLGGLTVQGDFLFGDPSAWRVVNLALAHRMPAIYTQTAGYVDQGGLMAYASNYNAFHRRAASFVDKLLRGAHAAALPIEQTTTFDFVINLHTAQALGLDIPAYVLVQATQVIQ
jgi:putative ABC transport system substrate-binding protein